MKLDHHAYKTSVMNENERDRSEFERQFLYRYLATNEGQALADINIGTHHGKMLHWTEQEYGCLMEEWKKLHTSLKTKYPNSPPASHAAEEANSTLTQKNVEAEEGISTQTQKVVKAYQTAIKIDLKARVRYFKARVLNEIKQRKPTKVQLPEPSSENKIRSPKLQQHCK